MTYQPAPIHNHAFQFNIGKSYPYQHIGNNSVDKKNVLVFLKTVHFHLEQFTKEMSRKKILSTFTSMPKNSHP